MNPLRLRASNYRTFGDLDVAFTDGLTGILGELRDAPAGADSNGAGKSSILEAIDIALFGRRSLAGCLTRGGAATELMIELTFEHAGQVYRVRRTYSARGRGKTTVDFEVEGPDWHVEPDEHGDPMQVQSYPEWEPLTAESAKETQALIERTIGLSRDTFCNSSYLRQGDGSYADPARDPAERKKLLTEAALGRDPVWPHALERAKADRRQAEADIQRLAGEAGRLLETVTAKPGLVQEITVARDDQTRWTAKLELAEKQIVTIEERYRAAADTAGRRQALAAQLSHARAELEALQRADVAATEAVVAIAAARDELETLPTDGQTEQLVQRERDLIATIADHERAQIEHVTALQRARTAEAQKASLLQRAVEGRDQFQKIRAAIVDLESTPQDEAHCDRCGQVLAGSSRALAVDSMGKEANAYAVEAERLHHEAVTLSIPPVPAAPAAAPPDSELAEVRRALTAVHLQVQQRARLEERIVQLQHAVDRRPTEPMLDEWKTTALRLAALLDELEPVDLDAIKREGEQARADTTYLRREAEQAAATIVRLEERLAQVNAAAERAARIGLERLQLQNVLDECATLERAFGRDGVPALILENRVIPFLEEESTRLLAALGKPYQVELRTQAAKKDGGLKDTLEVVLVDENGEQPFDDFSKGEQSRIGIALKVSLAELMTATRGAESRVLIVDEPMFLDRSGMDALLDVLNDLLARAVFDKVIVVSHFAELRDSIENTILVVNDGGRSRVDGAPVAEAVAA